MNHKSKQEDKAGSARAFFSVLDWADRNGVPLLPCYCRSKKPYNNFVSTKGVYGNDTHPVGDNFHNPTSERLDKIKSFWEPYRNPCWNPYSQFADKFSASVDMNYPATDGFTITCIDVDTDDLYDEVLKVELFKGCTAVRGKKGVKILFKTEFEGINPPSLIQFFGTDLEHPAIEVFTANKHALIFGEHPESTRKVPIYYHFIRGIDSHLRILLWKDVKAVIEGFADAHNLKTGTEPAKPLLIQNGGVRREMTKIRQKYPDTTGLHVEVFLLPENSKRSGDTIQGAHPIHGSTTGLNLAIDTARNVWYCFRCKSGGGALEAAAVRAGIIKCSESKPGWRTLLRVDALRTWLSEQGFEVPTQPEWRIGLRMTFTEGMEEDPWQM